MYCTIKKKIQYYIRSDGAVVQSSRWGQHNKQGAVNSKMPLSIKQNMTTKPRDFNILILINLFVCLFVYRGQCTLIDVDILTTYTVPVWTFKGMGKCVRMFDW